MKKPIMQLLGYRRRRRGFTLTEMAIVLGVMSTIIGGIWTVSGSVSETRKENDAVTELQTVVQNMLNAFQGQYSQKCSTSTVISVWNLTSCMLSAGVIPNSYQDAGTPAQADNPWSTYTTTESSGGGGLYVWNPDSASKMPGKFRVSFYNIPYAACMALLLAATNCQAGQAGCPVQVWTNYANTSDYCVPNHSTCLSTSSGTTSGWSYLTPSQASILCGYNSYTSTTLPSSVEFDYMLE